MISLSSFPDGISWWSPSQEGPASPSALAETKRLEPVVSTSAPSPSSLPLASYGLSDPQKTKECFSRKHLANTAISIILGNSRSHKHKPTQTSFFALHLTAQSPKGSGAFVAHSPWFHWFVVTRKTLDLTALAQMLLVPCLLLPMQDPWPWILLPGNALRVSHVDPSEVHLTAMPTKHPFPPTKLPLGMTSTAWLPSSPTLMLLDNRHDAAEFQGGEQGRNACCCFSAGHFVTWAPKQHCLSPCENSCLL